MNFSDSYQTKNPREFLAVVLAGFGNELQPLTSNYGDQPCPKALLPIGNKPMISYVLSWIEESGINDVLLICPTSHRDAISHHINSDPSSSSLPALNIDIQTFDQKQDIPAGTASVLAHFATRILGDFVLLPCDFVPPPALRLETVLNKFRLESSTDGSIATSLYFETRRPEGEKSKGSGEEAWSAPPPPSPIVFEERSGTLLHVDTLDDKDRDGDELALRMSLLWQHPRVTLSTRFMDAHVYVCKRAVLDFLVLKQRFADSFREEFFPWLCKLQTHRARRQKYNKVLSGIPSSQSQTQSLALQHSTSFKPQTGHVSSPSLGSADSSPDVNKVDVNEQPLSLRIGIVIHPLQAGFAARANTIHTYFELNRLALGATASATSPRDPSLIDLKANVSADCLLGASTRVGERSTLKRTVVGAHCIIGKNVKLSGCVLMEYCVVGDGAKLDGCILGKNTKVGARAEIVRCVTQAGFDVEGGGVYKHEKLEISDWTTGGADEEEDGDEDESDGEGGESQSESEEM